MGLYLGRLVIGRIFASEIWGLIFKRAYFIYLFFIDVFVLEGGGGGRGFIIGMLRYVNTGCKSVLLV